jgi:glutamate-1-semialdehyde 2,1-aminomutase
MPVGAFAGRRELMQHLSPQGNVYQAGTLSGNPVAMSAGLATLQILHDEDGWARLARLGEYLERQLGTVLAAAATDVTLARIGSIFWLALHAAQAPRTAEAIDPRSGASYARVFSALLASGVALAPSAYEVGFLSLAHTKSDIDRLAESLAKALKTV